MEETALRVLHLAHGSPALDPRAGGTERYAHALAAARGDPLFTRDRGGPSGLRRVDGGGFPLWIAGVPAPPAPVFRDTWSVPAVEAALAQVIAEERPDVAHVHHLAHLGFGCVEALARAGVPAVVTLHDYHLACVRGQLVDRSLRRCPGPEEARCAACVAEHLRASPGLHRLGQIAGRLRGPARELVAAPPPGRRERARLRARTAAARRALTLAAGVIAPSQALAERFRAAGLREDIEVLDLPLVAPIPPAPEPPPGPVRFLFVGGLIPTKGADVLIDAFARVQGGELALYGPVVPFDGHPGWGERLVARAAATPGARYGGCFGDEARASVYAGADVLVVPSIWEENSPLVIREALAAGLRVVASRVGGVLELDPRVRAVSPGDPAALAGALEDEIARGRGRIAPRRWPMEAHLARLDARYRTARG